MRAGPGLPPALPSLLTHSAPPHQDHPACRLASLRLERWGEVLQEGPDTPLPFLNSVLYLSTIIGFLASSRIFLAVSGSPASAKAAAMDRASILLEAARMVLVRSSRSTGLRI